MKEAWHAASWMELFAIKKSAIGSGIGNWNKGNSECDASRIAILFTLVKRISPRAITMTARVAAWYTGASTMEFRHMMTARKAWPPIQGAVVPDQA